jgi:hypothetical protein
MQLGLFLVKPGSFYFLLSHLLSCHSCSLLSVMGGYQNVLASGHVFYWQCLSLSMPAATVCLANKNCVSLDIEICTSILVSFLRLWSSYRPSHCVIQILGSGF